MTGTDIETARPQTLCVFPAEPAGVPCPGDPCEPVPAPQPMVDQWCQAYLEQNGEPCRCNLCQPLTATDNVTEERRRLRGQCQPLDTDNVTDELMALVRAGDEAGFRELAGCVMPAGEVDECWAGARGRLGLPGPPVSLPPAGQEIAEIMQPLTEWAEGLQERPFDGRSITEMLGQYIYGEGS